MVETEQETLNKRVVFATLTQEDAKKAVNLDEAIEMVIPSSALTALEHPFCHTKVPIPAEWNNEYHKLINALISSGGAPTPESIQRLEQDKYITLEVAELLRQRYNALPKELR